MKKVKRKRAHKRALNKKIECKIYGINSAGIKSKKKSFETILKTIKPTIWMVQETKLRANETISCEGLENFQVYYLNRQNLQGGGVALGVTKELKSTLVNEGNDETEVISVKVFFKDISVRVLTAYGPQENASREKKDKFWEFLEKEVIDSELENEGLVIQMDGNLHGGQDILIKDPNTQNQNGKLFNEFLKRNPTLIVVNALDICEGLVTRKRKLESRTEIAVLDFFIINEKLRPLVTKMKIDENKEFGLVNIAQVKKNKRIIETDHNALILDLDLKVINNKAKREEIYNLKNKACQEAFYEETEKNKELLNCFENDLPFEKQCQKWKQIFDNIIKKCFRKIRIKPKKIETENEKLLIERLELKRQAKVSNIDDVVKQNLEEKIEKIENDIGEHVGKENYMAIAETIKELGYDNVNGTGRRKVWKILKKKFPKKSHVVPVGKKDSKGKIVTNHEQLKHLYLKTYRQRMRSRPMKDKLENLKELKNNLFDLRLELSKENKTRPWKMIHLETVLKGLKKDKSRDPNGWINELFKDGVIGNNLKKSLLCIFNRIKEKNQIPDFVRLADVSTIYKGKGSKSELVNERGIFVVSILRNILMKLIYMDYYSVLENSMSDSQIGARKGKNIRDHIWIVNGIITDVKSSKNKKPVDIQVFDYKQCFDALWLQECMNEFYEAGLNDDKFAVLHNSNKIVKIAVRTPVGKTDRTSIKDVITQGDVIAPMFCSKQVDTFGQECLKQNKHLYLYRGEVPIPPLSMVDDLLCVTECGFQTISANAFITFKTDTKKLQFGAKKCKKLHVGAKFEKFKCETLKIDNWEEVEMVNDETGIEEIKDVLNGELTMEESQDEKYLGDVISTDGKNIKNVKARISKGKGIISRIMTILEGIPFGHFYFEVALMLRNSLLVSSMLLNTEAWYNLTKPELNLLETIDIQFLRSILKAPKCTPKEMLFLELGVVPFKQLIMKRRILYLHHILNENENSMLNRFLVVQFRKKKKKDWISQVLDDLEKLKMDDNMENLKLMKKSKLKNLLENSIKQNALEELSKIKENHSKVREIKHEKFEMQNYFKSYHMKMTQDEILEIFKMRCRVTNVKQNFRGKYESIECNLCQEEESQKHIINCIELNKYARQNDRKNIEYKEIFKQNVRNQMVIMKKFRENLRIREKMEKK